MCRQKESAKTRFGTGLNGLLKKLGANFRSVLNLPTMWGSLILYSVLLQNYTPYFFLSFTNNKKIEIKQEQVRNFCYYLESKNLKKSVFMSDNG